MEIYEIKNLTFTYPTRDTAALSDLTLTIGRGEFITVCGPSGCGKTTLLRHLKPSTTPRGTKSGSILIYGVSPEKLPERDAAAKIGFVSQSPENQIVTDKVWHELAFGLESLGIKTPEIRLRVAEMASFFGIQEWFHKPVTELSGGQKQMLTLASIMAMQPEVLILDEPTGQIDPLAAGEFLGTIGKINRELGVTVILTEHRLEEAFPLSTRAIVMDGGRIAADGAPCEVGLQLRRQRHGMFLAMPAPMRVWGSLQGASCGARVGEGERGSVELTPLAVPGARDECCTITVREGADWLEKQYAHIMRKGKTGLNESIPPEPPEPDAGKVAAKLDGVWFKYAKDLPDVIKGLTFEIKHGEITALLGGNGTGKTTTLLLIGGLYKPYRGKVTAAEQVYILPQNPQSLFVEKTVRGDLLEALSERKLSEDAKRGRLEATVKLCQLEDLLDEHPYDLSGGEQQRAALAKVLLLEPRILLLDEPTKGLDAEFKQEFAAILKELTGKGVAVVIASHDVEFCAEHADRCALFFDGSIITENSPREFFSGNSFYTTSANRMARKVLPTAITVRDIVLALEGKAEGKGEGKGEPGAGTNPGDEGSATDGRENAQSGEGVALNGKADAPDMKADAPDMKADAPDMKADAPDMKADAPDMKADASDVKADAPDAKVDAPDVKADAPDEEADAPDAKVNAPDGGVAPPSRATALARSHPEGKKKLPVSRKIVAGVFAALLVAAIVFASLNFDGLRSFISGGSEAYAVADEGAPLYIGIMLALAAGIAGVTFALTNKTETKPAPSVAASKNKLTKRTIAAAAMILVAIPITIYLGTYLFGDRKYYFISLLVVLETMLPFAMVFEGRKPQAREMVAIAALCAIAVAGRVAFFMLPQFKPVVALVIISGVAFGGEAGFLVGAMTGFISNFYFQQGPWTPYQMFALGVIGFLAGVLFRKGMLRRAPFSLAVFGALATLIIYGGIMNPSFALIYQNTPTGTMFLAAYLQGIPFDLVHAAATVTFLSIFARPMLEKLDRIKIKYGLVE